MHHYSAFHLAIQSALAFPELLPSTTALLTPDITIQYGAVSKEGLSHPTTRGLFYQATEQTFWLHVPKIAHFLMEEGTQLTIDPTQGIDEDSLRVFILGSCFGALLMQRNLLLLHGNAIQINNVCVSFVGHSGAGKSTLSAAFFKRGYGILADDVCAITHTGQVVPSFPQIKLWQDAAHHLEIDTSTARKIRPAIEKYAIPLNTRFQPNALPLKVVYSLQSHNIDKIQLESLHGIKKLSPIQNHTYRKSYLKGLLRDKTHWVRCAELAKQTAVVRLTRPREGFQLDNLVTVIENDLQQRGFLHDD